MTEALDIAQEAHQLVGGGLQDVYSKWPRLFMGLVHHPTTKGQRMTFADKPWLTEIYKDNSKQMVIIKCSQVHMTEHALCAMFTLAKKGVRGMYVLPSKEHRKTFVADRINRMKDHSPLYANAIKIGENETDSNVYKNIFGSGWKFVGSNVRGDFFEFPCRALFFDEHDLLDQDNMWFAYDRVGDEADPYIYKFGNPTTDGEGRIYNEFLDSDQKEWHVTCEHCGHEQILDWYDHFVVESAGTWVLRHPTGMPICTQCGKGFDRLGFGRWIALNPGVPISGYRISRLFVNKHKQPNDIVWLYKRFIRAQHNPTALQNFHNNYLGIPYENIEFKITQALLQKCAMRVPLDEYDPQTFRALMGVDQGRHFTCVISIVIEGKLYDVHYANVSKWAEVEALETTFNVVCTVVDANGGGYEEVRDFVRKKGTRWMCYYRPKDQIKQQFNQIHAQQIVEVNRTEILDTMVSAFKNGRRVIPQDFLTRDNGQYFKQMTVPSRVTDSGGRPIWTKGTDHYFHASGYNQLALLVSGMQHSALTQSSWHVGQPIIKQRSQVPTAKVIGEEQKNTETPIKTDRSWHV